MKNGEILAVLKSDQQSFWFKIRMATYYDS